MALVRRQAGLHRLHTGRAGSAHGTALGFLMQYDQLSFPDAVEELASRLGVVVPREGGDAPQTRGNDALHELLDRVATHYEAQLADSQRAQQYLQQRGLQIDWKALEATTYDRLVTTMAMVCPFGPVEKQNLLQAADLAERARLLTGLVEMALLERPGGGSLRKPCEVLAISACSSGRKTT